MKNVFCMCGIHKYESLGVTNCFRTGYTDKNYEVKHILWYQKCSHCEKRNCKDTVDDDLLYGGYHAGLEKAKIDWIQHGRMYFGDGNYSYDKPKKKKPNLYIIGGNKK